MSKHPINKLSMDGMHTSQKKGISLLHIFRKVFLIINHQGNANENCYEIPS